MNSQEIYASAKLAEQQGSTLCAELLRQAAESLAKMEAEIAALQVGKVDEPTIGNLVILVARLVQQVRKHDPENDVAEKSMDYLRRSNLEGTILRDIKKRIPQPESEAADA